jgi:hypothetical protein
MLIAQRLMGPIAWIGRQILEVCYPTVYSAVYKAPPMGLGLTMGGLCRPADKVWGRAKHLYCIEQ